MSDREPFRLSDHDKATSLWLRFKSHLLDRLVDARVRNDSAMGEYETASLRGEIKCLKRIIALGDARPDMTGTDDQPPD
jgi:hypothetical protein